MYIKKSTIIPQVVIFSLQIEWSKTRGIVYDRAHSFTHT